MVWGTGAARRHERTLDPDLSAPIPQTAICARCDKTAVLAAGRLPPDWRLEDGEAICGDCANVGSSTAAMIRQAIERGAGRATAIPHNGEPSRYRGCRISHEIALGMAAIQIRAGAVPPQGRDEAVQFLLTAHALDEFIIELSTIRAELTASQTPGTDAREGGVRGH